MAIVAKLPFFLSLIFFSLKLQFLVDADDKVAQVPCYFVFGDSLADNGNNNDIQSLAKVNYPPYGMDFRDGPTGRFTNGRTYVDIIDDLLGFTVYSPPYASAKGQDILKGVNYASGGAGILPETGKILGERYSMDAQLRNHNNTIYQIFELQGNNKTTTASHLNKCIYVVGMGSNDYLNNYFLPKSYTSSSLYTPDQYANVVVRQYSKQLTSLYNYGARKVAIFGLGQVGCTPAAVAMFAAGNPTPKLGCVDEVNAAVAMFNNKLKPLVDDLNRKLKGAHFIYVNTSHITLTGPLLVGITAITGPCCKVSNITGLCITKEGACSDRNTHSFFDAFHPTEKSNLPISARAYKAISPFDAYPMDIYHLAQLPC